MNPSFYMEDIIIPETCVLTGAMLNNAKCIFEGLVVTNEVMRRNLDMLNGLTMTEHLMLAPTKKTGKKQTAHAIIHKFAMEAFERNVPIDQLILASDEILQYLPKEEMEELLKPENPLGMTQWCIDNVIKQSGIIERKIPADGSFLSNTINHDLPDCLINGSWGSKILKDIPRPFPEQTMLWKWVSEGYPTGLQ